MTVSSVMVALKLSTMTMSRMSSIRGMSAAAIATNRPTSQYASNTSDSATECQQQALARQLLNNPPAPSARQIPSAAKSRAPTVVSEPLVDVPTPEAV
ncbi:MAG: hypothetical protein J2P41_03305 [Blastocatellia bacterium]|nr:hypothetical protein [Blastocatellia bacterium]